MQGKQFISFEASRKMARRARVAAAMRGESRSALIRRAVLVELRRLEVQGAQAAQEVQS